MRALAILLAVALFGLGYFALRRAQKEQPAFERINAPVAETPSPLTRLYPVPDFSLTERSGRPVTLAELHGKIWVADFFYTTCPGPCPMLSSRLSEVQSALGNDPDVRLVSISSDPEKDTPDVLKEYAERFKASPDKWLFLTGSKTDIYALANRGFKLALAEDPTAKEPITHATKLVLVDREGQVRGYYEGVGGSTKRLLADIERLKAGQ